MSDNSENMMNTLYRNAYRDGAFLVVTGDTDFEDYAFMSAELDRLLFVEDFCGDFEKHTVKIITGMENGAEALAIRYADERHLSKILFSTNYDFHLQLAISLRNEDMMRLATHLVVFGGRESQYTTEIIELAIHKEMPYILMKTT